jgi:hypothetical protein
VRTPAINSRVQRAVKDLLKNDGCLLRNDLNERAITHRLAAYLQQEFTGWKVDCEYNRNHDDPKKLYLPSRNSLSSDDTHARTVFPDIIVHHRNTDENLLVIEVKKSTGRKPEDFDKQKLRAFKRELGYRFAAFIRFETGGDEGYRLEWID